MPRRRVRLQPRANELIYGFMHGDESYIKRSIREQHLEDRIIYQFRIAEPIREDRLDRLFIGSAESFRQGPYNRFFVLTDRADEFVDEFQRLWASVVPRNDADALEVVRNRLLNR